MSQAASSQGVGALSRRQMLRLCAGTGVLALTGCGAKQPPPTLLAADGMLPSLWTRALPSPWRLERSADAVACDAERFRSADLLALSDGWLGRCQSADLQPLEADPLLRDLDDQASAYRAALAPDLAATLLPVAVSPYVIVWRQHASLKETPQDWTWLLQPPLARRLVLPASPRLAIELAARISEGRPTRVQALTSTTGKVRTGWQGNPRGVLPLQRRWRCCVVIMILGILPAEGLRTGCFPDRHRRAGSAESRGLSCSTWWRSWHCPVDRCHR